MRLTRSLTLAISLFLLAAGPGVGQDMTGTWLLTVELDVGTGDATFVLTQNDGAISGTYTGVLGELSVSGTIEGDSVQWSFDSEAGEIRFKGTVDGSTIQGTCVYGQLGSGNFEGHKRE